MNENRYKELIETIRTPDGLSDRVLFAARRQGAPSRRAAPRRNRLRAAVCAACALALVLGTWTLRPAGPKDAAQPDDGVPVRVPNWSFGLTAYAADTGETQEPNANGGLAFLSGAGLMDVERGVYTGCLFQVKGEEIETISLSIDKGGLYRCETHTNLTEQELSAFRQAMEDGTLAPAAISRDDDGVWSMPELTELGTSVTEPYDPAVQYGFWVPPENMVMDRNLDPEKEAAANVDVFDGASLTVRVTRKDGSTQTKEYRLSTGRLKTVLDKDGVWRMLPQLAGDDEQSNYGIYAVDQAESRFFQWPVQGANTVSMSNPFGERALAVDTEPGQEGDPATAAQLAEMGFHSGIDIPAASGTPILAAADGTVKETGFDARRGNYLVIDHGGGLETVYAQCRNVDVTEGAVVKAGEMVAALGSTGMSTGPHLCFQVWQDGSAQDPVAYFDADVRALLQLG